MSKIPVANKSSLYDLIYVSRSEPLECLCLIPELSPAYTPNLGLLHHVCENCGNIVDDETVDAYNHYYGYNGHDEFNDAEECAA